MTSDLHQRNIYGPLLLLKMCLEISYNELSNADTPLRKVKLSLSFLVLPQVSRSVELFLSIGKHGGGHQGEGAREEMFLAENL